MMKALIDKGQTLPTLSIITPALNCEKVLEECYSRIASQNYPDHKIEMLLIDGGSTDKTKEVARRFGARVIEGGYPENQEPRRYIGVLNAKNDILVYIDSDNFVSGRDWLRKMVKPFLEDSEIIATQPMRYEYKKEQSVMNRYFALFGVNDPVAFYLKKADRVPWYEERWNLLGDVLYENDDYYKIRFNPDSLPTVGSNGFFIRKSVVRKLQWEPEKFMHIDVIYDLVKIGFADFGIVKTSITHNTCETFGGAIRKRMNYMKLHHYKLAKYRRYKVFDVNKNEDVRNLIKFIIFACTFIKPFYDSFRGFLKVRDIAWFIHPLICVGFVLGYGCSFFRNIWESKALIAKC